MIREDYCDFETSRLLKEKGFNEAVLFTINEEGFQQYPKNLEFEYLHNSEIPDDEYACPTLQMAMKWLREMHRLYINIWADPKDVESNDFDIIFRAQVYNGTSNYGTHEFSTYEEAAEAAIKYCLENLI